MNIIFDKIPRKSNTQYLVKPKMVQHYAVIQWNMFTLTHVFSCFIIIFIIIDYILFNFTYNIICFIALEKGFTQFSLIDC